MSKILPQDTLILELLADQASVAKYEIEEVFKEGKFILEIRKEFEDENFFNHVKVYDYKKIELCISDMDFFSYIVGEYFPKLKYNHLKRFACFSSCVKTDTTFKNFQMLSVDTLEKFLIYLHKS